jgi:hypothetical protein
MMLQLMILVYQLVVKCLESLLLIIFGSCIVNVESGNVLFAELTGATLAIELAINKGWNKLRFETYSKQGFGFQFDLYSALEATN